MSNTRLFTPEEIIKEIINFIENRKQTFLCMRVMFTSAGHARMG